MKKQLVKAICIKQCDNQMHPSVDCLENNTYFIDIHGNNAYYYYVYFNDHSMIGAFEKDCFIFLSEYREQQIDELLK